MFFDVFLLSFQFDRFVASASSIIIICLTWFSNYAISGYRVLCKFHAFITCVFAVGLCKSFLMEGVSNHDRTIGED